jgi:hypothetical protein
MFVRSSRLFLAWVAAASVVALAQTSAPPSPSQYSILTRDAIVARLKQYSGSDQDRERRLKDWFLEAGCPKDHLIEQDAVRSAPPNLICTLPGDTDSIILVSAHFDYVSRGEGVVDNWSGASLLPGFASTLKQSARHHTFVFIAFTEEEKHMLGSEFYVRHLTPEERGRIAAVINLDTLGLAPSEVWVSHSDPELVRVLTGVAHALSLPLSGVNVDQVGSTDSESFAPYKIPRITVHSLTQDTLRVLHSPRDQFSAMHLDDYYATYRLLTAYLVTLDGYLGRKMDAPRPAAPDKETSTPPPAQ